MGSLQNESLPRPSSSIPPRRAACTHLTLTRIYGPFRCSHCNRCPRLGWVYRCTQDHGGHHASQGLDEKKTWDTLAAATDGACSVSNLVSVDDDASEESNGSESHIVQLSPWMEEAVEKGQYSPDQVTVLRAQRQKVHDMLQQDKNIAQLQHKFRLVTSLSTFLSTSSSDLTFQILTVNVSQERLFSDLTLKVNDKPSKSPPFQPCSYKCCQSCRPASKDRAWQYLVSIVRSSVPIPIIDFSKDNRPVSNVEILRRLSTHKDKEPSTTMSKSDEMVISTIDEQRYVLPNPKPYQPTFSLTGQGIREIKRAFHGMLMSRRRPSRSSQSSQQSRRSRFREHKMEEIDLGLGQGDRPDLLLSQAIRTQLPDDGEDGWMDYQDGEVIVEDGVAVTEEAIDLGTADIIMSA